MSAHEPGALRRITLPVLTAALLATGCGTKAELEESQSRLTAMEGERKRLEQDLTDLRSDYKEVLRGWGVAPTEESLTEGVLLDVEGRIQELRMSLADEVSPMVQQQLEEQLGDLVTALAQEFDDLDGRYTRIASQLGEVRGSLDIANQRLLGIETTGADIQTELVAQQIDEGRLEEELESIATVLEEFDERHLLCRDCPEYLSLKRKRQDVIIAFHSDLRSALRRVPTSVTRPPMATHDSEAVGDDDGREGEQGTEESDGDQD